MTGSDRGWLRPADEAPVQGEVSALLATASGFSVEQILSGELEGPVTYRQDHDEFALVLAGGAVLELGGDLVTLAVGEWVLIPRGVAHRLVSTRPGTSWLAVRSQPRPSPDGTPPD
jgi:cupin 2 domain-containing protein